MKAVASFAIVRVAIADRDLLEIDLLINLLTHITTTKILWFLSGCVSVRPDVAEIMGQASF